MFWMWLIADKEEWVGATAGHLDVITEYNGELYNVNSENVKVTEKEKEKERKTLKSEKNIVLATALDYAAAKKHLRGLTKENGAQQNVNILSERFLETRFSLEQEEVLCKIHCAMQSRFDYLFDPRRYQDALPRTEFSLEDLS